MRIIMFIWTILFFMAMSKSMCNTLKEVSQPDFINKKIAEEHEWVDKEKKDYENSILELEECRVHYREFYKENPSFLKRHFSRGRATVEEAVEEECNSHKGSVEHHKMQLEKQTKYADKTIEGIKSRTSAGYRVSEVMTQLMVWGVVWMIGPFILIGLFLGLFKK